MRINLGASLAIVAGLMLSGCGDDEQAWIVLDFKTPNGKTAAMAFNNPSAPSASLKQCEAALTKAQSSLINAARQREPALRNAQFVGAKCVMSVDDPIKPKT
jgi:hypothetical protein